MHRKFSKYATLHPTVKLLPHASIDNLFDKKNAITVKGNTTIRGQLLTFAHGGNIEIGKDCYIGENTRIWSANSVKIGDRVLIAHNVNIHDNNSHSLDSETRHRHYMQIISSGHPKDNTADILSDPITICDDVWIGFNSTILKGVKIGRGSIVAAASVVTKNVPDSVVVAGNPSKIIKKLPISD